MDTKEEGGRAMNWETEIDIDFYVTQLLPIWPHRLLSLRSSVLAFALSVPHHGSPL